MRALLMKDFYVLFKQMKLFFVMILFFSLIPNQNMASFAAVYAGMLPFSALAYDEQSKWDQLAVTMPYSRRDLVLSKYVLGYLACGASMLLCLGITGLCAALKLPVGNTFAPGTALLMAAFGPIFVAVTLPPHGSLWRGAGAHDYAAGHGIGRRVHGGPHAAAAR